MNKEDLPTLYEYFEDVYFENGNVILKRGQTINNLYYITKGIVYEKPGIIEDENAVKIKNKSGDILGLRAMLGDARSFTNCYAQTMVSCKKFPINALLSLIKTEEQEKMLWEQIITPMIISLYPSIFGKLKDLTPTQIKGLLKDSRYRKYEKGSKIKLEYGGILLEGKIEERYNDDSEHVNPISIFQDGDFIDQQNRKIFIRAYAFIYPNTSNYKVISNCRLFEFPMTLKDKWLGFSNELFLEALNNLPSMLSVNSNNRMDHIESFARKQKAVAFGVPKVLAQNETIQKFKKRGKPNSVHLPKDKLSHTLPHNQKITLLDLKNDAYLERKEVIKPEDNKASSDSKTKDDLEANNASSKPEDSSNINFHPINRESNPNQVAYNGYDSDIDNHSAAGNDT